MANQKRTYENKVTLIGELKELEVKDLTTKKGVPMKIANLKVKTGEGEVHNATLMAMEYFERDGNKEENSTYKAIQTMENEYISIKDISEKGLELPPTVVRVNGGIENNMYKNTRSGDVEERTQITARFVNRLDNVNPDNFGADFIIETFVITQPTRLTDKEENETDTVEFKVATIDYRGEAHPFTVQANEEYGVADWVEQNLEKGQTITINGVWHNKYIINQVERPNPTGIGKPIVDTQREINNSILVEGITPIEDEDDVRNISTETIKEAMKAYEQHKLDIKSKEDKPVTKGVKGVQTNQVTKPKTKITKEDLPF